MGRKSNTKKVIREILEEKAEKGKSTGLFKNLSRSPSKKDLKRQLSQKSQNRHKRSDVSSNKKKAQVKEVKINEPKEKLHLRVHKHLKKHRRSIFGGLLTVIMVALLASIAYLLFNKAFRADPVAKYLPAKGTVAILELNTNFDHNQLSKSFDLLKNHPEYSQTELIKKAEIALSVNYETEIKPWLGRETAVAFFNSEKAMGHLDEAYFAEFMSAEGVNTFLTSRTVSKRIYENQDIYTLNNKYFATIIGPYLALASEEGSLTDLIDFQKSSEDALYDASKYRRIDDNLPLNKVAFSYIDFDNIQDSFFQRFPILSEKGLSLQVLSPFVKIFDAQGSALVALDDNFAVQSFMSLDPQVIDNSDILTGTKNYTASLTSYVKKDTLLFWGAQDLSSQFGRLLELLSAGEDLTKGVFDKVLNNYVKKYFGETVGLEDDILPLLADEFAFTIERGKDNKNIYKLLISLQNGKVDALKLQDLASQFASVGAVFAPKVVEHILPDGTVSKEVVAVPEEISKNQTTYKDTTIYELKAGSQGWGIYYAFLDTIAVIASSEQGIKDSLDLSENSAESLHNSANFTSTIAPVLQSSDELSYFNIQAIAPLVLGKTAMPDVLKIFDVLGSGKSYFNDGITTINYLKLK